MKNKIKHLSEGDFSTPQPDILIPETHIVMRVGEGEIYKGSFSLQAEAKENIRGLVYPSSYRVHCSEEGFEDNPVNITYTYDGTGLIPGHVEHGKFTIVCTGGEFEIAFTAIIEKPYVMTQYGKVQSLDDFKRLAYQDPAEAEKLFRSRDFYEILKYEDKRVQALYENMRKWELGQHALEEFLVGCKQKEKIFLTLDEVSHAFTDVEKISKEFFTVNKNTWGYLEIQVQADGDFLSVDQKVINSDEFIGNSCRVEYTIDPSKLHAGNNFGQILLETPYETLSYEVVVEKKTSDEEEREERRAAKAKFASIFKSYLSYEAGEVDLNTWTDEAIDRINELREADENNEMYLLAHAHICLIGQRMDEAKWLLDSYSYNRFAIGKDAELSSYYLYLTYLLNDDPSSQRRVADELNKVFMRHNDSWMILCMLILVDPEYKIYSERLRVMEQQFNQYGVNAAPFYLVAFHCFKEKSSSLKKLGTFESQVLLFAAKYKLMTRELALYAANLAGQLKYFDRHLYHALELSYKMYPEPMILTAICNLLIKGNCTDNQYFTWYEKAVEGDLKLTQLYEFFMASLNPELYQKQLPRSVYLYFMHGNHLDYRKCAFLYANMITYEDETSEIYAHYRDEIEEFSWNQLDQRHIDSSLRVIYKRYIPNHALSADRMAALNDICYAYEITTKMKDMKYIHVVEEDGTVSQKVPYTENGTYVFLYDKTSRLVWEGNDGHFYTDSIPYESKRMFYELRYIDLCKKYYSHQNAVNEEGNEKELTLEMVRETGLENYNDSELLALCSRTIRESNYEGNDFLTYVCFELFQKKQYDKITLTYLASYYCGATEEMKDLWREARDYEVNTHKLGERILTQMLFTEEVFGEEAIFEDYYQEGAYYRLQQAYLIYMSREYVTKDRKMGKGFMDIVCGEYERGEEIADICKAAVLKYYADRECEGSLRRTLKEFLQQLCDKQMYFPFFLSYDKEWLMEVQLWDKTLISYRGHKGGRVMLCYQLEKGNSENVDYSTEVLNPMYDNVYVKKFVLFANEELKYYFKEIIDGNTYRTDKKTISKKVESGEEGRFGRLNDILLSGGGQKEELITDYAEEDQLASYMFNQYEGGN